MNDKNQTFARFSMMVGEDGIEKLNNSRVIVFGVGGVGSYTVEALARAGVGHITMVDFDEISESNINRQLHSLRSTIGKSKVDVMKDRILDINPEINLKKINEFLEPERMEEILTQEKFDYVLDCIDSLSPKLALIITCKRKKIKLVSAMGAGGKTDPSKVMVRDISKTNNCFLAKQIRKKLKKEQIHKGFRCVFSTEIQDENSLKMTDGSNYKKSFYGTISYMPAIFGLYAAAEVIRFLLKKEQNEA